MTLLLKFCWPHFWNIFCIVNTYHQLLFWLKKIVTTHWFQVHSLLTDRQTRPASSLLISLKVIIRHHFYEVCVETEESESWISMELWGLNLSWDTQRKQLPWEATEGHAALPGGERREGGGDWPCPTFIYLRFSSWSHSDYPEVSVKRKLSHLAD